MTPEIYTTLTDLPTTIYSFVRQNRDGSYTIVLNARLSAEDRLRHYRHELDHIGNCDLYYNLNLSLSNSLYFRAIQACQGANLNAILK